MLQYDIPDRSGCPNPSRWLRRVAIRTNLSVWVVREDFIPYNRLDRMRQEGALWHLVPFDPSANDTILSLCAEALAASVAETEKSCQRSLDREAGKLDDSGNGVRYSRRVDQIVKQNCAKLADLRAAAAAYGIVNQADDVLARFTSFSTLYHARVGVYAGLTGAVAGTALQLAAEADDVPPAILADFVEDNTGADMSSVQALFSEAV
jgi:hypothetical protein